MRFAMANKMTNPRKGVGVKINGKNAVKIIKIIEKTHRTFASEVNLGVEEYADRLRKLRSRPPE